MTIRISSAPRNANERITPVRVSKLIGKITAAPVPATDAGRFLHRRHHVDPRIADLLAEFAGLGEVEARP